MDNSELKNKLSWDIVFWPEENSTDYVPSIWAGRDGRYKYPVGKLRISEAKTRQKIKECIDLLDGEFLWFSAICRKKNVQCLEIAKLYKNIKAVETSNMESPKEMVADENGAHKMVEAKNSLRIQENILGSRDSKPSCSAGCTRQYAELHSKITQIMEQQREQTESLKLIINFLIINKQSIRKELNKSKENF